jgi:hypothetical protein
LLIFASKFAREGANFRRKLKVCPSVLYLFLFPGFRSGECQRKVVCEFWRNKSTSGHMHAQHFLLVLPVNYFMGPCVRSGECQKKMVCEFWRNKSTSGHMQAMHSICYSFYLLIVLCFYVPGLVNVRGRWSVSSGGTNPPVDTCKPCTAFATRSTC